MATEATATLDANDEVCGPILVSQGERASFCVVITGTITVTLKRKILGLAFITVQKPDGDDAAYSSGSVTEQIDAPGEYELIASDTSGGSAVCGLLVHR